MNLDTIAKKRKSVRSFKKKKVSWKLVLDAIDVSLQGPFAGNHNGLNFLIIENKEVIKEVASFCDQSWISEAPLLVLVCSNDTHLENLYGERGRVYSRQQAGAAIQTFLLKLTELGVGSCWVGAYSDELIKQRLKIPQHIQIEAIIPMGYSDDKEGKKTKKSLESVLYWEKWKEERRPTKFEEGREDYNPTRFG